jgi:hypothetical protein
MPIFNICKKHMIKKGSCILLICFMFVTSPAQTVAKLMQGRWAAIEAGYSKQGQERIEAGAGWRRVLRYYSPADTAYLHHNAAFSWGPQLNMVALVNRNNVLRIGQKLGYALEYKHLRKRTWGFNAGIFIENYTRQDQRISFEAGTLLLAAFHLNYGYTLPLGNATFSDIQRHKIGIFLHFNTSGIDDLWLLGRR